MEFFRATLEREKFSAQTQLFVKDNLYNLDGIALLYSGIILKVSP
jgi:hypothetical protein